MTIKTVGFENRAHVFTEVDCEEAVSGGKDPAESETGGGTSE